MITANESMLTEEQKGFIENYISGMIDGSKEEEPNRSPCIYRKDMGGRFDIGNYCSKDMKRKSKAGMDIDRPLKEPKARKCVRKLLKQLQNKRKAERKAEDLMRMDANASLKDKDGKLIEVKTPEPECMAGSI